jgi:predicted RNase H-like nuclease (RuvC/YqgF family)
MTRLVRVFFRLQFKQAQRRLMRSFKKGVGQMPNETTETTNEDTTTTAATTTATTTADTKTAGADTKAKGDDNHQDDGKTFSADYVKDLRKESADYRNKAKELQRKAEEAEAKAAELNNNLKASQEEAKNALHESKRLNTAFEQRLINAELKAAAMEAGLVDMDAFRMVDVSKIKITDKGEVVGVKELITDLKKDKSYLFKDINTSNKNAKAPDQDANAGEKPTYATPKELADAERKFLASLR